MRRIVCFGDSNTYGFDPRSFFGDRYPAEVRWTGLLRLAGWDVVNLGQNGRAIPTREGELRTAAGAVARAQPAALVTVMLGGNDLLQTPGFTAADTAARMERFLPCLLAAAPDCRLLLVAPPPMRPGEWVGEDRLLTESARLGAAYRALARRLGVEFADAGAWDVPLAFDGVHFTEAGHAAFARGMGETLQALFGGPEDGTERGVF